MTIARKRFRTRSRRGFTLVELMITTVLTVTFIYVVSIFSIAVDRAGVEVISRCNLAREADIAFTRFADDLRGAAAAQPNKMTLVHDVNQVTLSFVNDVTVVYSVSNGQLIREVTPSANGPETIAWSVQGLSATQVVSGGNLYQIQLTLGNSIMENRSQDQTLSRTFTLVTVIP